jgi:sec-independent protein translocase protein TatB
MLDFGWSQMLLIAAVALIVLGPKELPKVIKSVTEWAGKARSLAREFRSSVDEMMRETELKNLKEEFESGVRKAETEFQNTIQAETAAFDALSPKPADTSAAPALPDYYATANWGGETGAKLRPLMDHQRKKKPVRAAAKPVYKARLTSLPPPRRGPPDVRRRVRA